MPPSPGPLPPPIPSISTTSYRKSLISFYDWAQYPGSLINVTSGSFEIDFPAKNMLSIQPQIVARAIGTSVTFTINLPATRVIGLIHLQNLVTDFTGTIHVTAGTYDSGIVNSWATDASGVYSQLLYTALGRPRVFIPDIPVSTDSVTIEINGMIAPLMIGFVGICEVWEMPNDMLAGPITTIIDESNVQNVPFGSTYVVPRATRRKIEFGGPLLQDINALGPIQDFVIAFDLAMMNGRANPVIVSKYPDDINNLERNTIWGLISNDQPFTNRFYGFHDTTFQVTQLV